ncbi:hypothetical protein TVAG_574690 [Trichomonas vaginalis G3]|uniref:Flavodoxin-like fold domain-containing protein n=1 Tax=Trichomonas vaginalis (strain ATCC PRA-98 / G3) TaxID=412133 RepID=A2G0H6_TRIV3|nr:NAD(P)H oxidoreductase-related family [Trichomonas vaginalis G3]EAX89333.1 hypothetical protein TVAG_574690 [Trichomonas vaginalis G3]KAI5495841.1 NAD(P)H oxidoreductase-related family [Trichomonas vaginalis G3]|eukprot:XP_001302263.1 hypothetical protein [Trichomonas vaginalis G3]
MRVLILIAHADSTHKATAFRIAKAAEEAFDAAKIEYREVILHEAGFDQTLTERDFIERKSDHFDYIANRVEGNIVDVIVKQEQNVAWATNILVVGPMWYFRYPACFQAWIERVLSGTKGEGKRVSFVISNEADEEYYSEHSPEAGSIEQLLFSEYVAFIYSKYTVTRPLGYYNAGMGKIPDPEKEKVWMAKFKKIVVDLDKWQLWGTHANKPPLSPDTMIE